MGSGAAIPLPPGPTGFPTDSRGRWRTKEMPQKAGSQANGFSATLRSPSSTLIPLSGFVKRSSKKKGAPVVQEFLGNLVHCNFLVGTFLPDAAIETM